MRCSGDEMLGSATELPGTEPTCNGGAEICTARARQGCAPRRKAEHWQWRERHCIGNGMNGFGKVKHGEAKEKHCSVEQRKG